MIIELLRGLSLGGAVACACFSIALFLTSSDLALGDTQRWKAFRASVVFSVLAVVLAVSALWLAFRPTGVPVLDAYRASPPGQPWVVSRDFYRLRLR